MLLRDLFRPFQKKLEKVPAGRLLVFGEIAGGERAFGPEDLRQLAPEFQTDDVVHFKAGFSGRAVRLAGLLEVCQPESGPLYLNAASRDGKKLLSLWLAEVAPLGWIVYGAADRPFQLVLPGFNGPRERIDDLALLEVSSHGERELRA
jgi:hypothetical protein